MLRGCPSNSALVETTNLFQKTVLSLLLRYCHHPRKSQLCCCGAWDVNWRMYIFPTYLKSPSLIFISVQCNSSFNTSGHMSSNASQQSKITSFSMDTSLNRAGQGTPSGPAASSQGLLLGPDQQCDTPMGLFPLKLAGRVQHACWEWSLAFTVLQTMLRNFLGKCKLVCAKTVQGSMPAN